MRLEKFPRKQTHKKRLKRSRLAKHLSSVRLKKTQELKRDRFLAKPNSLEALEDALLISLGNLRNDCRLHPKFQDGGQRSTAATTKASVEATGTHSLQGPEMMY